MRRALWIGLVGLVPFAPGAVAAASSADELRATIGALRHCASMADAPQRLRCFDELAARATPPAAAAAPAVTAPAPPDFGLSPAQRPPVEEVAAITARVVGLGRSANARPTVQLDNGQLWELDAADPLLATGQSVTIRRGALGSFLLRTESQRTHQAHRLR